MCNKKRFIIGSIAILSAINLTANANEPTLEVSGLVEVELGSSSTDITGGGTEKESAISLATVELGFDSKINKDVSAHVLLLFEEGDTELDVDEGTITIGDEENGFHVTIGKMYVPFGVFDTNVVSDPLTLELGEINESAVLVGFATGNFHGSIYLFNGSTIESSSTDDTIEHSGLSLGFTTDDIDVGIDYISSIGESGLFTDGDPGDVIFNDPSALKSYVAGIAVHAAYSIGDFNIIVEHIAAQDKFDVSDFQAVPGKGVEPSATNIDLGYSLGKNNIGLALQSSDDADDFLPEKKTILAYSRELYEATSLAVEYASAEDYAGLESTAITVQVAVEF